MYSVAGVMTLSLKFGFVEMKFYDRFNSSSFKKLCYWKKGKIPFILQKGGMNDRY